MDAGEPKKRVLIVEDDPNLLRVYQFRFHDENFLVDIAKDGKECLEALKDSVPDIILLDIMLPKMDGLEVLDHIRRDPRTAHVPVLIFSNSTDPDLMRRVCSLGALDFLVKVHTTPDDVVKRVKAGTEHAAPPRYVLAVEPAQRDASRLALDLHLPEPFQCPKCAETLVLNVAPVPQRDEQVFFAMLACPGCAWTPPAPSHATATGTPENKPSPSADTLEHRIPPVRSPR